MASSDRRTFGSFDLMQLARALPERAETLLIDHRMTDEPESSARVFRVYRPTPPHYHATCDEYLYVLAGRGTYWLNEPDIKEFGPGQLLFFKRNTVHAFPTLLEEPVLFFSVDTPRRDPTDIIFVNPEDGTPESFIQAHQS